MDAELGRLYHTLIDRCTLYEFDTNYALKSKSLESFLPSKNIAGVESLKARCVAFRLPTLHVYYLKQYELAENVPLQHSVSIDYGFVSCKNQTQIKKLRKIYKQLFEHKNFDILRLHETCISGTIYKYAS
jgi:hypothetical protein